MLVTQNEVLDAGPLRLIGAQSREGYCPASADELLWVSTRTVDNPHMLGPDCEDVVRD